MPNETNTMHALEKAYCTVLFANQSRNAKARTE